MIQTFHLLLTVPASTPQTVRSTRLPQRVALLTLFSLIAGIFVVAMPSLASAESLLAHPPIRVYRRRPVILVNQEPPAPRRVEIVHRHPEPAAARTTNDDTFVPTLGIGIRANGTALSGEKLNLDTVENPVMGGIGLQFRSDLDEHWGLELSVDFLQGTESGESFTQRTVPVMLSALFNPFPNSRIRPYGLLGVGVHFTELSYLDGQFKHDIVEIAGQAGLGLEVKVTNQVSLHADLRFLTVYKNLDSQSRISTQCMSSDAAASGLCAGMDKINTDDRFNLGAQFQEGATYYF